MRVLVIHVQRMLDAECERVVGDGIAKLVAAFIMGRRGVIAQDAENEIEVIDDDEIAEEQLGSVTSLVQLLNRRKSKKGVTAFNR